MRNPYLCLLLTALAGALTACAPATPEPTPTALPTAALQVVILPTVPALQPTATPEPPPTAAPTATPEPPTAAPGGASAPSAPAGNTVEIFLPANVRSGPGTNYPALGGLTVGSTPTALGRNAAGDWFAIDYGGQTGWVANLVARYPGDLNALPVLAAPPPPAPTPTFTAPPPPTNAPPPTAPPPPPTRLRANYFRVENPDAGANQDIWFQFEVVNTSGSDITYGCLGAKIPNGQAQCSWSNEVLKANAVLTWRDHINIPAPGTYTVQLAICYLVSRSQCESTPSGGHWEFLSSGVTVVVR